jgi:hypothetical protein
MDTAVWYIRERFQDKGGSCARELEELETVWFENCSGTVGSENK